MDSGTTSYFVRMLLIFGTDVRDVEADITGPLPIMSPIKPRMLDLIPYWYLMNKKLEDIE